MFGSILKAVGIPMAKNIGTGIASNPSGFLWNSADPANIAGHSGSNILANFANPGGGTMISPNYLTPNNMPTDPSNMQAINGVGGIGGVGALPAMGSGIPAGQLPGLNSAYANFLMSIGQPGMSQSFMQQQQPPAPPPGQMNPGAMSQLQQLMQSVRGEQRVPFSQPRMGPAFQVR